MTKSVNYFTIFLLSFLLSCSGDNENTVADNKVTDQDPGEQVEDAVRADDAIQGKEPNQLSATSVEKIPKKTTSNNDVEKLEDILTGQKTEPVKTYPGVDNDVAAFCTCVEKQSRQCEDEMEALEGHFRSGIKSYEAWKARALIRCPDAIESIEQMK